MRDGQIIKPIHGSPIVNPHEKILLRKRQHWFILAISILVSLVMGLLLMLLNYSIFSLVFHDYNLLLIFSLAIFLSISTVITKVVADWHCHFYLLTNRRVLEISYKPLFANNINNVILNQVKSTEIDIEKKGFINQILDIGNVMITFDRPTHQEEFCFMNIKDPRSVGFLLADVLDMNKEELDLMSSPIWYRARDGEKSYKITEEIFPGGSVEAI